MSGTVVVTDSTSALPEGEPERLGVRVVPLKVDLGGRRGVDGVDVAPSDLVTALRRRERVTTSRPSPGEFAAAYRAALDGGADAVVSVHLSAQLSGTFDSACLAAQDFPPGVVRVVDSRSTAMGLGFAVLAAATAARDGGGATRVQDAAVAAVDATSSVFSVDSLDYLRRGGRIGAAAALLGGSLAIRPLLQVTEGRIVPLEKVRTSSKARARLVQVIAERAGVGPVDLAVQHLDAPGAAAELAERVREAVTDVRSLVTTEIGPVVGAHLGPGTLGIVLHRAG